MLPSKNYKEKIILLIIERLMLLIRVIAWTIILPITFALTVVVKQLSLTALIFNAFLMGIFCISLAIEAFNPEKFLAQLTIKTLNKISTTEKKEFALSIRYLKYIKRTNWKLKLILLICTGIFFGLSWKFPHMNLSIIPLVLLFCISLLIAKEQVMEYRIRKGLFGTNRTEAKALIEFIIKNSDDIDFTDSNGNLRRALLPEAEPTTAEQPLPTFGEETSA
ncbi:MAG: hypothetical protein D3915_14955 [Candidatus Electrothrix sp. AU1_5]|nr:hypothetical protein [Candidatus Electrothrix gigas]